MRPRTAWGSTSSAILGRCWWGGVGRGRGRGGVGRGRDGGVGRCRMARTSSGKVDDPCRPSSGGLELGVLVSCDSTNTAGWGIWVLSSETAVAATVGLHVHMQACMYILLVLLLPDGDGCARSHREISTWPAVGTGSQQLSPAKICNRDRRLYLASPLRRQPSLLLFSDTARCCLDICSYRRVSLSRSLAKGTRYPPRPQRARRAHRSQSVRLPAGARCRLHSRVPDMPIRRTAHVHTRLDMATKS